MAKEIHEQPEVVGHTLAHYVDMATMRLKPFDWPVDPKTLSRVTIIGCGTAYMAGLVGEVLDRALRPAAGRDRRRLGIPLPRGAGRPERLTIVISQSGETADTLASLKYVKERGVEDDRRGQRARLRASPA